MANRLHLTSVRTDAITHLPSGGIKVEAVLARSGVLEYRTPAGVTRELRPAAVLADAAAVESLKGATVTVHHPRDQRITTDNYRAHTVGHVADVRAVGDQLLGDVIIMDESAIRAIEAGELIELSPGYTVELDSTPGVDPDYGEYDSATTRMTFNHISLLPPGRGRQGAGVSLRLDSADNAVLDYTQGTTTPERNDMNPAELEKIFEDLKSSVMQAVLDAIPELIAQKMAEAASAAPATEAEEMVADAESELEDEVLDSEKPLEDRLDSRLLDIVRAVERATGKPADLKLSPRVLLAQASQAAGLQLRADASCERLLGALEAQPQGSALRASLQTRTDSAALRPVLSMDEVNARAIAAMGSKG